MALRVAFIIHRGTELIKHTKIVIMQQLFSLLCVALAYTCSILGTDTLPLAPHQIPAPQIIRVPVRLNFDSLARARALNLKVKAHTDSLRLHYKRGHTAAIDFIYNYSRIAQEVWEKYGVPPEITMAVGMYESARGTSQLAVYGRNFFGIKKGTYGGLTVWIGAVEWRAYNNTADSFMDFGEWMQGKITHTKPEVPPFYNGKPKKYNHNINKIIKRYNLKKLFTL